MLNGENAQNVTPKNWAIKDGKKKSRTKIQLTMLYYPATAGKLFAIEFSP